MKTVSLCNRRNPKHANAQAQSELNNAYLKEQTQYIQNQINKIRKNMMTWKLYPYAIGETQNMPMLRHKAN